MFVKYYSSEDAANAISPYHIGDIVKTDLETTTKSGIIEAGTSVAIIKVKPKAEYKSMFSNIPIGKENDYIAEPSTCKYSIKVNNSDVLTVNGEDIFDWKSPKRTKLYNKCNRHLITFCIGFYGLFIASIALMITSGVFDMYMTENNPYCPIWLATGLFGLLIYFVAILGHLCSGGVDYALFSLDDQCTFYTKDTENSLSAFRAFCHLD